MKCDICGSEIDGKYAIYMNATSEIKHVCKPCLRKIEKGIIKPDVPFYTYIPGRSKVDAITSPTELYFAKRGLLYSYVGGKRYDTTFLHIREWLECIRDRNKKTSCGIDAAFEEAITAHMGTRAYLEGRTMYWDKDKEEIIRGEIS